MKKLIVLVLLLSVFLTGCSSEVAKPEVTPSATPETQVTTNFTDEMKIPYVTDMSEDDGSDSAERMGDHAQSPYFVSNDYYNMESTDSLTILTNFKTQQQTTEWSCGVSAALMVLNYYGALGDYTEETLSDFRSNKQTPEATSLTQLMEVFEGVGGFDLYSTFDHLDDIDEVFTLDFIKENLANDTPIIVGWNDFGGHWQVIIGYDDLGTETTQDDVIIVADSYDSTDHNQDGYGVYPAERFIYNFTFYDFFEEDQINDKAFLIVNPKD